MNRKMITAVVLILFAMTGFRPFSGSLLSEDEAVRPDKPVVAASSIPSFGLTISGDWTTDTLTNEEETETEDSNSELFSEVLDPDQWKFLDDELLQEEIGSADGPTSIFVTDETETDIFPPQQLPTELDPEQLKMLNDLLVEGGTSLIQNADLDAAYRGIKDFVISLETITEFWEGYDFAQIEDGFTEFAHQFILAIADESFPEVLFQGILSSGAPVEIPVTVDGETQTYTFSQIDDDEYLLSPQFTIKLEGEIVHIADLEGNPLAQFTRQFDPAVPDQVLFTIKNYEADQTVDLVFIAADAELIVTADGQKMIHVKANPETSSIEIDENISPSLSKLSFDAEAGTITLTSRKIDAVPNEAPLLNEEQSETETDTPIAALRIDGEQKEVAFSVEEEVVFSVRFVDADQIQINAGGSANLLQFDDDLQQLSWIPEEEGAPEFSLAFSGTENQLTLQSNLATGVLEEFVSIHLDREKNAIDLTIPGSAPFSLIFDQEAGQILYSDGQSEFPLDPEMLQMFLPSTAQY